MIQLHYWPTPNGHKVTLFLEEAGLERLMGVLDRRLAGREFIAGDALTIADMACHPWIDAYAKAPLDMARYPDLRRWHGAVGARPAVQRAYAVGKTIQPDGAKPMTEAERRVLFGGGR